MTFSAAAEFRGHSGHTHSDRAAKEEETKQQSCRRDDYAQKCSIMICFSRERSTKGRLLLPLPPIILVNFAAFPRAPYRQGSALLACGLRSFKGTHERSTDSVH